MLGGVPLALACGSGSADDEPGGDDAETSAGTGTACEDPPALVLTDAAGRRTVSRLAEFDQIPGLADQETASGRVISTLHAHRGQVHIGYGDFSNNTGPITMVAYDPQLGEMVSHGVATTEDVQRFLSVADTLFAGNVDPRGHEALGSVFRLDSPCGTWETMPPIAGNVHTFGLTAFRDRLHVTTGSLTAEPAFVMSSPDLGASWQTELSVQSAGAEFTRIHDAGGNSTRLLVSGRRLGTDDPARTHFAYVYGDQSWTQLVDLPDGDRFVPIVVDETIAIAAFSGTVGDGGSYLASYQLEGSTLVPLQLLPEAESLINWSVETGSVGEPQRIWALVAAVDGTHQIKLSDGLASWIDIVALPELAGLRPRSIAYLGNQIYIGTADGELYVVEEIYAPQDR